MHLPQLNLLYIFLNSCHWWAILALGRHVRDRKVVYLGETHGEPAVVGLHTAVLDTLVTQVHDFKKSRQIRIKLQKDKLYWVQICIVGRRERFRCKSFSLYGTFQSWASGIIKGSLWFSLWFLMYSKFALSLKPNNHQDLLDRFQAGDVKEEELQEQYDRCSMSRRRFFEQMQFSGWATKDSCWLNTLPYFDLPRSTPKQ